MQALQLRENRLMDGSSTWDVVYRPEAEQEAVVIPCIDRARAIIFMQRLKASIKNCCVDSTAVEFGTFTVTS